MKILLTYLCLLFPASQIHAAVPLHDEVRLLYQKAAVEEASCRKLVKLLQPYNEKNNTVLSGYKACATMMMAKHVLNPLRKLSTFSKGKALLEKSIDADRFNIELRFLRFTIQTNAPSFLDYSSNIRQDKLFLINTVSSLTDLKLKQFITDFLDASTYLTSSEKKQLNL